jgi:hypothetical protein
MPHESDAEKREKPGAQRFVAAGPEPAADCDTLAQFWLRYLKL